MRIAEMLYAIASWLESPNNEALLLAEYDDDCLEVVADSCVAAAAILKNAADHVDDIEVPDDSHITPESLEELANLATALDSSDDPSLKKQASVIDELLLTIATNPNALAAKHAADEKKIDELKKKYENPRNDLEEANKIADSRKAIEKSPMMKEYAIMEAPLSSRYCPDHAGAQIARIGEHIWQCELDKKTYNFDTGFTLINGSKVPGGDVSQQTQGISMPQQSIFDSRESRLNNNNG